jgi:uncharacterized protein (TIGR02678 family)
MRPTVGLTDVLTHQANDERERAVRALLMRPLIIEGHADFFVVRRHAQYLRDWFSRETGWRLHIERGFARLFKKPANTADTSRGLTGFDRERYVLLGLTCAVLERSESQITLQRLGEQLLEASADAELASRGFVFTLELQPQRRALVQVCRFLLNSGVLSRVVGDEETYINRSGDVLYDINRRILAILPVSARGASLIAATQPNLDFEEILARLMEEYVPDSLEGRRTALRHRLSRQLLDDPALYYEELSEDERQYLSSQRGPMATRLSQATGLIPELRAEGLALVDEDGALSDTQLPAVGTQAHATLLVAEHLANAAKEDPEALHSLHELASFIRVAADTYGKYWRKESRAPGAESDLTEQAISHLEGLKLVQRVHGGVRARPALLRFAVRPPELQG